MNIAAIIALISEDPPEHSPYIILIKECKVLLEDSGCILRHTLKEGNKVADRLANIGVDQEDKMVSYIIPSYDLIPLLEADTRGVFSIFLCTQKKKLTILFPLCESENVGDYEQVHN